MRRKISIGPCYTRKQIRVSKVLVHENFTDSLNDIALLRLGKNFFSDFWQNPRGTGGSLSFQSYLSSHLRCKLWGQDRTCLWWTFSKLSSFTHSPALGWGDTGIQETSTDKLQETLVPIIQTSKCLEKMNQTEGPHVDESRIVCTGDAGSGGPCQVTQKPNLFLVLNILIQGWQWWATNSSQQARFSHSCRDCQQTAWRHMQPAKLCCLHQCPCSLTMDRVHNQGKRRNGFLQLQLLCSAIPRTRYHLPPQ